MKKLRLENNNFYLGEEKFQIISGAIHYFRCHPDDWEDRLFKLKACGFNTVETCIPWNLHEPQEGNYNFTGFGDLERFIQLSHKVGLYLIVRPGPYMCGEWDFGGFPSWIMKKEKMELRCMDLNYLKYVDRYFDVVIPKLVKYLPENDGNLIAVQIENEYGSYGCDKEYLEYLRDGLLNRGLDTFFVTSDGSLFSMLTAGSYIYGFENYELSLNNIENLKYEPFDFYREPVFLKGEFHISEKKNTYLDMRGFKKGVVYLNGFCLGRYWEIGPQRDLYIPKGLLQEGKNELVIFELHSYQDRISFSKERIFTEIHNNE